MATEHSSPHLWIVGGGIAGLAAAAFAIRDADFHGKIHILEELPVAGGSMDGGISPVTPGALVTRGGRMLEQRAYACTWNLFATIPSAQDPDTTVLQEIIDFNETVRTHARARLIDARHRIIDTRDLGLSIRDKLAMGRLIMSPEGLLGSRRIDEVFTGRFFTSAFWQMWRTTFAFQKWHSAAELRRYFLRFAHLFKNLGTLSDVRRTPLNQYASMIRPLRTWLADQYQHGRPQVDFRFDTRVVDLDLTDDGTSAGRRVTGLHLVTDNGREHIPVGWDDHVLITIGSITADSRYGGDDTVARLVRDRVDHSWSLWEEIARKAPDLGQPMTFCGNIDEHKWESFTLTMDNDTLVNRIAEYSRNEPGTGALMTWVASGWHLSIVVPHQPHFPGMAPGQRTLWGYGFDIDHTGDRITKKMSQATGKEILTELVHHLGFDDILDEVLRTTRVTTVMMPYASAAFACRKPGDRPKVVPDRSGNFAFLGQFAELPEDVVFTVEYSVRTAMRAVYTLFNIQKDLPRIYHPVLDPRVDLSVLRTLLR
jgi:oleate hydratase